MACKAAATTNECAPNIFLPFVGGPQTISILYLPGIEADVVTYLVPSGWSIAEQFQTNLLK